MHLEVIGREDSDELRASKIERNKETRTAVNAMIYCVLKPGRYFVEEKQMVLRDRPKSNYIDFNHPDIPDYIEMLQQKYGQ